MPTPASPERPRPGRLTYLSDADKTAIYEAALEIIGSIGMRVLHPEALELLRAAGCEVTEPDLVRIPRELVEKARSTAPAMIEIYDRAGEPAMSLGRSNSYFGTGSDLMSTYDLETGEHRPSALADVARAARLCDALPNIDFVMSCAHPNDIEPQRSYLESFKAMVANTTKPMVMTSEHAGDLAVMMRHRRGAARRAGRAGRQALLHHVPRAGEPAEPPGREHRQAPLLRRPRHPGDLLAGAAGGRHGADHRRRPHLPGGGRVALRARHPPAAQAGRAVPLRHRPGRARHGHVAELVQRARVPDDVPLPDRDGALARPAQLGLRRHVRLAGRGRAGRHGDRRAGVPVPRRGLQPQPRRGLPGLRPHRVARAHRHRGRVHLAQPQALRRRRGDAGDAGGRRDPRRRPRRRLPRPPPHRQERAQGAVAPDDHQPPGPRALGGRGRARPQGESPPQGPQAARDAPARAAAGRAGGAHRRAGRRVHAGRCAAIVPRRRAEPWAPASRTSPTTTRPPSTRPRSRSWAPSASGSITRRRWSCCARPAPRSSSPTSSRCRASSWRRHGARRRRSSRSTTAPASTPCRSAATTRTSATARRSPASTTWRPASTGPRSSPTARWRRASATPSRTSTSSWPTLIRATSIRIVALLASFRAMVKNTTKPLVVVAENAGDLAVMTDIAEAVRGGDAGARREAVLRPLPRADERPEPPGRQPRQAALLRRPRHPGDLLAGAAGRRHGADHHRRADLPGHGGVAARPGHPPAAQAGRAVPVRHRPGGARHGDRRRARTTRPST